MAGRGVGGEGYWAVAGLGFGDEGKGTITDWLVRATGADLVVRFNGGPQAAHHVTAPDGRRHRFSQFGSGTLVPGVRTLLGPQMLFDPLALLEEAERLDAIGAGDALERLAVDERCVVITPFHRILNRMQELARGAARHGSCGLGIAQARLDAESGSLPYLTAGDLRDAERARRLLRFIQLVKSDQAEQLVDRTTLPALTGLLDEIREPGYADDVAEAFQQALAAGGFAIVSAEESARIIGSASGVVFEGAQGALLDRDRGFWPHVTPSFTDFRHAEELLADAGASAPLVRLGVVRGYATRHGEGPLVSEDPQLKALLPEADNADDGWQGPMRTGGFDAVATRYAVQLVGGVDALAVTCLDRLEGLARLPFCSAYEPAGPREESDDLFEWDDDRVVDLAWRKETTRERQGRLTAALQDCRPVVEEIPGTGAERSEALLRRMEAACGVAVGVWSVGPAAADKQGRAPPSLDTDRNAGVDWRT